MTPSKPSTLSAGADRARGERAKRRRTPLLTTPEPPAPDAPAPDAPVAEPPSPKQFAPEPPAVDAPVPDAPVAEPSVPEPSAGQAATHPPASDGIRESAPAEPDAPTEAAGPSKHRPHPVVSSTPTERVRTLSGERRVPRRSPRATRAADRDAAAALRPVDPPVPAATRRREEARLRAQALTAPSLDPSLVAADVSLPMPQIEDLLLGIIGALRIAAAGAGFSPEDIEVKIASLLAYVRRRLEGDYTVDEFGYDADFTQTLVYPVLRLIYQKWFRVELRGVENIPAEGGALLVANHSGTVAIDSIMLQLGIHDEHPQHRAMRALGADLVFQTPFLGTYARRTGSTLAANTDADRLLAAGELVGVFPEGFKGVGKPFSERYKLQRFGRGGFVSAALKAQVPIIPVSIVGAEEIAPIIGNMPLVARLLGLPYAPVTPTFPLLGPLGLIPLPSKWIIEIGTPIPTDDLGDKAADDPMLVFDLTDRVRETIQQTLYTLLMQRRSVFF